jgi:CBS domain-containing protein
MTGGAKDPVPRIGMLAAANEKPISVCRDTGLIRAVTLMRLHDFSQLPVMQNDRNVAGMVSWKSIGRSRSDSEDRQYVRGCMDVDVKILSYDVPLFDALQTLIDHEAVLVKGSDNNITGLVTTSDITLEFRALSESFLLLGEIERHVRRIADQRFTLEVLRNAVDPVDERRKEHVKHISDLTFGELIRLLDTLENWSRLDLCLDRTVIISRLRKVGEIRNRVMHFRSDRISDDGVVILRETVRFMQQL